MFNDILRRIWELQPAGRETEASSGGRGGVAVFEARVRTMMEDDEEMSMLDALLSALPDPEHPVAVPLAV